MYRLRLSSHIKSSRCTRAKSPEPRAWLHTAQVTTRTRDEGDATAQGHVRRSRLSHRCTSSRRLFVLTRNTQWRSARIEGPNAQIAYESMMTAGGTWSRDGGTCMKLIAHPKHITRSILYKVKSTSPFQKNKKPRTSIAGQLIQGPTPRKS